MPHRVKPEDYEQPPQPERSLDVPAVAEEEPEAPAKVSRKKGK